MSLELIFWLRLIFLGGLFLILLLLALMNVFGNKKNN